MKIIAEYELSTEGSTLLLPAKYKVVCLQRRTDHISIFIEHEQQTAKKRFPVRFSTYKSYKEVAGEYVDTVFSGGVSGEALHVYRVSV